MLMLAYDVNTNPLNNIEWAFPLTECFHIAAFALSIGTISIVDLRLLGLGMRHQTAGQLAKDTSLWTFAGLVIVILSGLMIFSSDPVMYYHNASFRFKVVCLLVAIVFNYTIHNKVALSEPAPIVAKIVGGLSLVLWVAVVFRGLWIAFI
jgi:hypothetical protein